MDYTSVSQYPTVDLINELAVLQDQNEDLIDVLNKQKDKIDEDVAHGRIEAVTAFMRYEGLKRKGVTLRKLLNMGFASKIIIKEEK